MKNKANMVWLPLAGEVSLSFSSKAWWNEAKTKAELKGCFASHYTAS